MVKRGRRCKKEKSYSVYIYKVLKQVHPGLCVKRNYLLAFLDIEQQKKKAVHVKLLLLFLAFLGCVTNSDTGISRASVEILNSFVRDMLGSIQTEASFLCQMLGTNTMTSHEIETAVRLILRGELPKVINFLPSELFVFFFQFLLLFSGLKHAVAHGRKAVTQFCANRNEGGKRSSNSARAGLVSVLLLFAVLVLLLPPHTTLSHNSSFHSSVCVFVRLLFPVGAIKTYLKEKSKLRIGKGKLNTLSFNTGLTNTTCHFHFFLSSTLAIMQRRQSILLLQWVCVLHFFTFVIVVTSFIFLAILFFNWHYYTNDDLIFVFFLFIPFLTEYLVAEILGFSLCSLCSLSLLSLCSLSLSLSHTHTQTHTHTHTHTQPTAHSPQPTVTMTRLIYAK